MCPSSHLSRIGHQPGQSAQVLGGCRHQKLVLCSGWSSETQAVEPENAFEMREQHLDLLASVAGRHIGTEARYQQYIRDFNSTFVGGMTLEDFFDKY
jgi:hypothetical protein